MKVILIDSLDEESLLNKIYASARMCYSPLGVRELWGETLNKSKDKKIGLIKKVIESGHTSTTEHVALTYLISGISRSCSHQLVRNRIASYSQASQRYINFSDKSFDFVTPPSIEKSPELLKEYEEFMYLCKQKYDKFVQAGIKPEDSRFMLPNAACTSISMTMNIRELMHVCGLRLCSRAQWEIRQLFKEIKRVTVKSYPFLEEYLQPNCEKLGYCPESHGSCGRKPKKL